MPDAAADLSPLRTAADVADLLGITRQAVETAAAKLDVGQLRRVGRRRFRLFSAADVRRLENRPPPGRPRGPAS